MKSRIFHTSRFHSADNPIEKKASWLELFYDLIYVAAFIQLGNVFSENVSWFMLFKCIGIFIPMWISWTGFTYYANRYTIDDFLFRILTFTKMFCVGAMAMSIKSLLDGSVLVFGLAFAISQLIIALLYLRSFIEESKGREFARVWGSIFFTNGLIWAISLVFQPYHTIGWMIGTTLVIISPFIGKIHEISNRFPFDQEHLSERYGLLTLIVLGESFVKVLSGMSDVGVGFLQIFYACFALLLTCSIWWIYFDDVVDTHLKENRFSMPIWLFSHIPLQFFIVMMGVAIKKSALLSMADVFPEKYKQLLAISIGVVLLSAAVIDSVTLRRNIELSDKSRVHTRLFSGILIILLGVISVPFSVYWFLAICLFIALFQIFFDVFSAPVRIDEKEIHHQKTGTSEAYLSGKRKEYSPKFFQLEPIRKGIPSDFKKDLYFFFMETSWTQVIIVLFFLYLVSNIFFACLYLLIPNPIANSSGQNFADAFFFSVQTMSTIGYGVLSPYGMYSNLIVTIEAAFSIIGLAMVTGMVFAKIAKPSAQIFFSKNILIHQFDGKRVLTFRMGNARGNDLIEAKVTLSLLKDYVTEEGIHIRKIYDLPLVRNRSPFFKLSWVVIHEINEESPLYGVDPESDEIQALLVSVSGHDATYSSTVFGRHVYRRNDILQDVYFEDIMNDMPDGRLMIDYDLFDAIKRS